LITTRFAMAHRKGFTLIELLIVIVILGIIVAIAAPKIGKARERAYFKAVMADLRNLQAQQELYFALPQNNFNYAAVRSDLTDFQTSNGVTIGLTTAGSTGWAATAGHAGFTSTQLCAVFAGTVSSVPAPATTPGIVTCTGE
jgi:type IV pilus assembly protein PilA